MARSAEPRFAIGVDYGTNSVRALVVDVADGPKSPRTSTTIPAARPASCSTPKDPNLARQNPADYIEGFYVSVRRAVAPRASPGFRPESVVGIGVDTTGSTPIPVDRHGMPLALQPKFQKDLAAHAWLWKDHTGHAEAAEITAKAAEHPDQYLAKCGGTYSCEWFWSKILHCKRTAPQVFAAAYSWVELADFVPAFITGDSTRRRCRRGVCAAGHKAMYNDQWGGLPSEAFLARLDPDLADRPPALCDQAVPSDQMAGRLTAEVAKKVGLPAGITVAVGAFDAHTAPSARASSRARWSRSSARAPAT